MKGLMNHVIRGLMDHVIRGLMDNVIEIDMISRFEDIGTAVSPVS